MEINSYMEYLITRMMRIQSAGLLDCFRQARLLDRAQQCLQQCIMTSA
jgi:hypothetical protein